MGQGTESTDSVTWHHHWTSGNLVTVSYGRRDSDHWLRFPGLADFRISANAQNIYCHPFPDIPLNTIRHLLLDQVLPRCMAHQGRVMLHASAIRTRKGTILFPGSSGSGKSTLAGYFHQSGDPAISDDCVLLLKEQDRVQAIPNYGGVRLWKDSQDFLFQPDQKTLDVAHYTTKQRVSLLSQATGDFEQDNSVLAVIFLPSPAPNSNDAELKITPLSMRDGYIEMLKQSYHLDVTDSNKISLNTQNLARIIRGIPLLQLKMPRDYKSLPIARRLILESVLPNSSIT
jgi:hypothetical protein